MGAIAEGMQTLVDEVKKSKKDRDNSEKLRLEKEEGRQEEGEEQRKEREGFVNDLITEDKERIKEAKHDFNLRKKEIKDRINSLKEFTNDVSSFMTEISDELDEAKHIWGGLTKSFKKHNTRNGKTRSMTRHSKPKKNKKSKR
jgi:hypothetical protein